jgi:uncharacterized membrane protein
MKISTWNIYYLISFIYIIFSVILGFLLNDGLVLFLGWNMILATIVLILTHVMSILKNKGNYPIIEYIILLAWILFFPNALYIASDLIHFQNYAFFKIYPNLYEFDITAWIVFTHLLVGALYAAKIGIESLHQMINLWEEQLSSQFKWILVNSLFLLASLGIYIGRFMRFNSWQFYKVFSIIRELLNNVLFMLIFVGLFFTIHWTFYILFKEHHVIKKSIDIQKEEI